MFATATHGVLHVLCSPLARAVISAGGALVLSVAGT